MHSTLSKVRRTLVKGCAASHVLATIAVAGLSATLPGNTAHAADEPQDGYWLASRCKGARLAYEARRDGLSGHVTVLYDIKPNGRTDNIRIVESTPEGVMDQNVTTAVRGWRYFAYFKDGQEMGRKDVKLTFTFGPKEAKEGKECTHTSLPESTTASLK